MKRIGWLLLLGWITTAAAEPVKPSSLDLSEDLLALLNEEMKAIQKGMQTLAVATAEGDWHTIAETGRAIHGSYILAQKLTGEQRHELHRKLPADFVTLDEAFHYYAGMLGHVAHEGDMDMVHFFTYKMNETCTACHAAYARDRFDGFSKPNRHRQMMQQHQH